MASELEHTGGVLKYLAGLNLALKDPDRKTSNTSGFGRHAYRICPEPRPQKNRLGYGRFSLPGEFESLGIGLKRIDGHNLAPYW